MRHETTYEYEDSVVTSHNEAHLKPRQLDRQRVGRSKIEIDPTPGTMVWRQDYFGNDALFFSLEQAHDTLVVVASSEIEILGEPREAPEPSPPWEGVVTAVRRERSAAFLDAFQFVFDSTSVKRSRALERYARPSFPAGGPVVESVLDLNHRIFSDFRYDQEATTVATPVAEVLRKRRGVCQDFAHVMIGCLRSLGLPARYVSGYVASPEMDGSEVPPTALAGADASHAWVAAFCGELGWIEVDPTNDLFVSDQHVVLGWGRDFDDVSPIKGVTLSGGRHQVSVEVEVRARP